MKDRRATKKKLSMPCDESIKLYDAEVGCCFVVICFLIHWNLLEYSLFVSLQYDKVNIENHEILRTYGIGFKDLYTVFFYSIIYHILHSFIHDVLDKIRLKFCMSKSKNLKFIESEQSIIFNVIYMIWAFIIIYKEKWLTDCSSLFTRYPNNTLSYSTKLFYILQFSYWAYNMAELYFRNFKKKELYKRVKYSVLNLVFVLVLYITNLNHIGVVILLLNYVSVVMKHTVQLIDINEKETSNKMIQLTKYLYTWLFFAVQVLILLLFQTWLWFDIKDVQYSKELRLKIIKSIFYSFSAVVMQVWVIYEIVNSQNSNRINKTTSLKQKHNIATIPIKCSLTQPTKT